MFTKALNSSSGTAILKVNIYRNTALSPGDPIEKKKFNINFHTLEPLGFEILFSTKVSIMISGNNIKGSGEIYYHNVDNIEYVDTVNVNETKAITIPGKGGLFLNVSNIVNTLGDYAFSFEVTLTLTNTNSYILIPTFDVRKKKIHNMTISDEALFNIALVNNSENAILMISDNIRIFMPKCKYIKTQFSPASVLQLHEEILTLYNKFAGLSINAVEKIDKPRRNFVLVSPRNKHVGYMSASSSMLDTNPKNSMAYLAPGWGIFHEYGHLYEQKWSYIEIWNNMYAKYMAEKTIDFTWLWGKDRIAYENKNIISLYEDYLVKGLFSEKTLGTSIGLYFFITLQEALDIDFVASMTELYRNNDIYYLNQDYIAYAIAKLYKVNAIPYMEMYGMTNFNTKVIDFVIDNSTVTLMYIPKNSNFSKYSSISIIPTVKSIYVGTLPNLKGICNPNSKINLTINTNKYNLNSDSTGAFSFTIPELLTENSIIKINSLEKGKSLSQTRTIKIQNLLSNNIFKFYGFDNGLIATVKFDVNSSVLLVSSTGRIADSSIGSIIYFDVSLYDTNGVLIATSSVNGNSNANNFAKTLNGKNFNYGYYIKINHKEPSKLSLDGHFENAPKNSLPFNFKNIDLTKVNFYLQNSGIVYEALMGNNIFSFYGLKNELISTIELDYSNKIISVRSTGIVAHKFLGNKLYFNFSLYDANGNLVITSSVNGISNADDFTGTLSGEPYENGYYIKIFHKESSRLSLEGSITNAPSSKLPLTFENIDLSKVTFYIENNRIRYAYI